MAFDICHTIGCKNGGLGMSRHNDLRDGVDDLARNSFNPKHVRADPRIYTGCAMHGGKDNLNRYPSKD